MIYLFIYLFIYKLENPPLGLIQIGGVKFWVPNLFIIYIRRSLWDMWCARGDLEDIDFSHPKKPFYFYRFFK
jgi:hypothetical protein